MCISVNCVCFSQLWVFQSAVSVSVNCVCISVNCVCFSELPANLTNDRTTVTLTEGQLTAAIAGQLRMTYDPISEIYVIETAMHVHNRSLGLLGTNTYDPGDDFLLPTGQIASGPTGFQEKVLPRDRIAVTLLSLQKLWSVDTVLWLCPSQL